MAIATNTAELNFLKLVFQNVDFANIGDATGLRGSSAAGNFYLSLHTADPGETGNQTTNEATYTGYARKAVARTAGEWTCATDGGGASTAKNTNQQAFDPCTGGSNTITHVGIGTASSGAGVLVFKIALTATLAVSNGITPTFAALALSVENQ